MFLYLRVCVTFCLFFCMLVAARKPTGLYFLRLDFYEILAKHHISGLQLPSVLLGSRYQKFLSDVPCDVYS